MLSIFRFLLSFLFFILSTLVCLYLPGFWLFKKIRLKVDKIEKISISLSLGIVFFVLLALIFGYLKVRFLLLPAVFLLSLVTLKKFGWEPISALNPKNWKLKNKKIFWAVLILGILAQVWINVFSGWQYSDGIRFWSAHGHDSVWHGSVMQEIRERFPPQMRFVSGFKIQNYHFFVDVLMGEFYRLFGFDPMDLYFRHFTFLFAALFLVNIFTFVRNWWNEKVGIWAMFLMIFAGSFGYILNLLKGQSLLGVRSEARFWVSQGNTAIGNPPQIMAFILFLAYLNLFYRWSKKGNRVLFWILVLMGSMLFGFKIYAGATIMGGLFLVSFWQLVFQKKMRVLKLFLVTLMPCLFVFFSTTSEGGSFLVFQPWWFIRTMVVAGDRLGWMDLEMRRQFYLAQQNWRGILRVFQFESLALLIFILGNLGTKILGFGEIFRVIGSRLKPAIFDLFLVFAAVICFFFPHVFVQRGVAWNTVQFFHYFVLMMALFAAVTMERIVSDKKSLGKIVFIGLIVVFSIPTILADLRFFAPNNALAVIENEELEALGILREKTSPGEVIVTHPFDRFAAQKHPDQPRPVYAWYSTGYVSYFADRPSFITDEEQVEIMGYTEGKKRIEDLQKYFFYSGGGRQHERDSFRARQFLLENNLEYVYLVYDQEFAFDPAAAGLEKIFENRVARIYKLVSSDDG